MCNIYILQRGLQAKAWTQGWDSLVPPIMWRLFFSFLSKMSKIDIKCTLHVTFLDCLVLKFCDIIGDLLLEWVRLPQGRTWHQIWQKHPSQEWEHFIYYICATSKNLPIVGMVVINSFCFSLNRMLVLPESSSPSVTTRISIFGPIWTRLSWKMIQMLTSKESEICSSCKNLSPNKTY